MAKLREIVYNKNSIIVFLTMICFGWIIYSPICIKYFTHGDGVSIGIVYKEYSEGIELGRIGIPLFDKYIMGRIVSPGLALLIVLAVSACVMIVLLRDYGVNNPCFNIIAVFLFLLNPVTSSTVIYYYCEIPYMTAFLLSFLSAEILIKKDRIESMVLGAAFIVVSLSLYQSYLSVVVVIFLMHVLYSALNGESLYRMAYLFVRFCVTVFIGIVGYISILKFGNVKLDNNRGFSNIGKINVSNLPGLIHRAYDGFFETLFGSRLLNNHWMGRNAIISIVFFTVFLEIIYGVYINKIYKEPIRMWIIIGVLFSIPLGVELMSLAAPDVDTFGTTGIMMIPTLPLVLLLPLLLNPLNKTDRNISNIAWHIVVFVPLMMLLWNLALYTYAFENVLWLNYNKTMMLCSKMSSTIDSRFEYKPNMEVLVAGDPEEGNYPCNYEKLRSIVKGSIAEKGMMWSGYLQSVCCSHIWKNYMGIDYSYPTIDEYYRIIKSSAYEKMDLFPNGNCVEQIDGVTVIKLGEK